MAESEEALQLKRRARRRLIGAIALVTFAVVILPLVLDKEPGPAGPPLSVQIPSQESGGFTTGTAPPAPAAAVAPVPEKMPASVPATAKAPEIATAPEKSIETAPVRAAPPAVRAVTSSAKSAPEVAREDAKAAAKRDEPQANTAPHGDAWAVSLDAFADKKNVTQLRSKLSAAGVKSYTEPVKTGKGELTRVRAGPFASKEAAEKVRARLQAMGLRPGAVTSR